MRTVLVSVVLLAACGDLSREGLVASLALSGCDRLEVCERIGEGRSYKNSQECHVNLEAYFSDLLPASACGNSQGDQDRNQIDEEALLTCEDFIADFPCDLILIESNALRNVCGPTKICQETL